MFCNQLMVALEKTFSVLVACGKEIYFSRRHTFKFIKLESFTENVETVIIKYDLAIKS